MREITIDGRRFELDEHAVTRALERVLPEPVYEHYVVIEGRRFPPKQVIGLVTGLDRAAFTTHHARRILSRLGFAAARRSQGGGPVEPREPATSPRGPRGGRHADALRPYIGQWVATQGDEVLVAAESPHAVVAWLARHGKTADSAFRVPESEAAAGGLAPR